MKEKGRKGGRNKEAIKADLDVMQSGGPRDSQQPPWAVHRTRRHSYYNTSCSYSPLQSQTSKHLQPFLLHYRGRHESKRFHTLERISSVWFEKHRICVWFWAPPSPSYMVLARSLCLWIVSLLNESWKHLPSKMVTGIKDYKITIWKVLGKHYMQEKTTRRWCLCNLR